MKVNEDAWKFIQQHLGYTDEELELFRSNPKNTDIVSKAPDLMNKTIFAEVVTWGTDHILMVHGLGAKSKGVLHFPGPFKQRISKKQ